MKSQSIGNEHSFKEHCQTVVGVNVSYSIHAKSEKGVSRQVASVESAAASNGRL